MSETDTRGVRPRWRRVGSAIRDGWLIVGVALVILAAPEGVYRAQASLRGSLRDTDNSEPWHSPRHPQAHEAWWASVPAVVIFGTNIRFDPYRGFWPTALASPTINVERDGRRRTVQPLANDSGATDILFLGGSVMWGWIVPDGSTIPSLTAQRLAALGRRVFAVNSAQPMYQLTQESATLLLELRAGRAAPVVVFLDGVNDVAAARENGEAGTIQDQAPFTRHFAEGREIGMWRHLALAGGSLALVRRLAMLRGPSGSAPAAGPALCADVGAQYVQLVRSIEAQGREFGFRPVFLWQPALATTHKALGAFERSVPDDPVLRAMLVRCRTVVDSLMEGRHGTLFADLSGVFDGDSVDVFWDHFGHVTEYGNRVLAERIARVVGPLLDPARSR